ncbi:MAG: FAD-dependent oxidoreductase [Candidatus Gracilibacteria bacterium]
MPYDLIVIGGGCAGLSASIYARRFNMNVLVVAEMLGGTITTTHLVENYPGFISISGGELANKFVEQATANGVTFKTGMKVTKVWKDGETFKVQAGEEILEAKTVILATGTTYRKIGIPGEKEFLARGVSYCATCDGGFFKGKNVIIVGGGNSAVKESIILAEHASHVTIVYRGSAFAKAEPQNVKNMEETPNISIRLNSNLAEITGDTAVREVKFEDGTKMPIDGVFVEVGRVPLTDMVNDLNVAKNEKGEIIINQMSETNIPGFYAAGDVSNSEWKQAIVSADEGCKAAFKAFEFVSAKK